MLKKILLASAVLTGILGVSAGSAGGGVASAGFMGEAGSAEGDAKAMLEIAAALTNRPASWTAATPLEEWEDVELNSLGRVEGLKLLSCEGALSAAMGELGALERLSMISCQLGDTLPDTFWNLRALQEIWMEKCSFVRFSEKIAQMRALEMLQVLHTPLGDSVVPLPWDKLENLEVLDFTDCGLTAIPPALAGSPRLFNLCLEKNKIRGPLPEWLFTPELALLTLRDNALSGPIPEALCRSPKLEKFDVRKNKLTGGLPLCLKDMAVQRLYVSGNKLDKDAEKILDDINFYDKHPFLRFRVQPQEDDSHCEGPVLALHNVTSPVRLCPGEFDYDHTPYTWHSTIKRTQFWGETLEFRCVLQLGKGQKPEDYTAAMNLALQQAEQVRREAVMAIITEDYYKIFKEEVDANKEEFPEITLPPRKRFGEVWFPVCVNADFRLENGVLEHTINITWATHDYYVGHFELWAKIEKGVLKSVAHP